MAITLNGTFTSILPNGNHKQFVFNVCGNGQAVIKTYVKMQKAKKSQVYVQEEQRDKAIIFEVIWYQCQGIQFT